MQTDPRMLIDWKRTGVLIDIVWLILTLISIFIFGYLTTWIDIDPNLSDKALIGFVFLIAGNVFMVMFSGVNVDRFIDFGEFLQSTQFIFLSVIAVMLLNIITSDATEIFAGTSLAATPVNRRVFNMLIGISETVLFQGLLQTVLYEYTKGNDLISILGTSIIAGIYHSAVYGLSNNLILFVIASFLVLCVAYRFSGNRISVPMIAHIIVNFMAG